MIDSGIASLALLVLIANSLAVMGWIRKDPVSIKVKGRRYL